MDRLYESHMGMVLYNNKERHSKPLYKTKVENKNVSRQKILMREIDRGQRPMQEIYTQAGQKVHWRPLIQWTKYLSERMTNGTMQSH